MDAGLRDLLALQAWELRNIAHELHDDPIQVLSVAVMRLDLLATRVHDADATERLDAVRDAVELWRVRAVGVDALRLPSSASNRRSSASGPNS